MVEWRQSVPNQNMKLPLEASGVTRISGVSSVSGVSIVLRVPRVSCSKGHKFVMVHKCLMGNKYFRGSHVWRLIYSDVF